MAIPTYDALMLPVLQLAAQHDWAMRDLISRIADDLGLTDSERVQMLPSGATSVIGSRVHWAKTYLKKSGLIEQPKRSVIAITSRGRAVLDRKLPRITPAILSEYPEFITFQKRTPDPPDEGKAPPPEDLFADSAATETPDDQIEVALSRITEALRDTLLERVLAASPAFFEKLIVDLLLAMGYGGSREQAGARLGGTGDGGVDGVIQEDHLGLDRIYLQAKRYQSGNTVGPETVRAFVGSLVNHNAQKGVLITTSTFTRKAIETAQQSGQYRIVLIAGAELTNLMLRFGVGVRTARTIEIKREDTEYFEQSEFT